MHRLESDQLLFGGLKHHFWGEDAAAISFGHLLDNTDNSGCDLTVSLINRFHQRRLFDLLVSLWVLDYIIVQAGIYRHRLVVLDPLCFRKHLDCYNIRV